MVKSVTRENIPTTTARERLLDAAEELFAERGFNGVSVREIATAACVNLGVIPYYFGTKENLLKNVFQRRVGPVQKERYARVKNVIRESRGGIPDVGKVLEAVYEPAFRQSRENDAYRRLAGRASTDPTAEVRRIINEIYNPDTMVAHKALRKACPHLSHDEFYWRFFCLHGAVQYVLADVGKIQVIAGEDFDTSDPQVAMQRVIPFLAAGLLAPSTAAPAAAATTSKRKRAAPRRNTVPKSRA